MAELRIKFILNKGRHGIPIDKFVKITEEAKKFLEMFASDLQLDEGTWIADNFKSGSAEMDTIHSGRTPDALVGLGQKAIVHLLDPETKPSDLAYGVRLETFLQFAKMTDPIEADDSIYLGVYNGEPEPKIVELTRKRCLEIERELVPREVVEYGSIQGIVNTHFLANNSFRIRELATGKWTLCRYTDKDYDRLWHSLESKNVILDVEGWKHLKGGKIEYLEVVHLDPSPEYLEGDLDKFFGCDPGFTGDMTTEEFLDQIRMDDSEAIFNELSDKPNA